MAFITKYGTYFGQVPVQLGRVHFVAPAASYTVDGRSYSASDDNDGLSPERALLTIDQAQTNATANAGEVVVLLEGTHAQTATLRLDKAGITYLGVRSSSATERITPAVWGGVLPKSVISCVGAAAPGLSIEADNIEIGHVTMRPAPGFSMVIFRNADPDGLYLHDFVLDLTLGQPSLATLGIDFGYRADTAGLAGTSMTRLRQTTQRATAYIADFSVLSAGAYGPGIQTATADVTVVNGRFHNRSGVWATPFAVATGTGYVFVKACTWTAQGTTGIGVSLDGTNAGTLANKVAAHDCRFPPRLSTAANSQVDNWAPGVISLVECYGGNNGNASDLPPGNVGVASVYQIISSA